MRALFSRFALPALIALVLLSGCGGGGDDASTTATATPSPTATPAGFAIASAASESYDGRPAAIVAFTARSGDFPVVDRVWTAELSAAK